MFSWQKLRWTRSKTGTSRITTGTIRKATCKSRFSVPTAHMGSAFRILPVVTEPSFLTPSTEKCGPTSSLLTVRLSRPSPQQSPICRNSALVSRYGILKIALLRFTSVMPVCKLSKLSKVNSHRQRNVISQSSSMPMLDQSTCSMQPGSLSRCCLTTGSRLNVRCSNSLTSKSLTLERLCTSVPSTLRPL